MKITVIGAGAMGSLFGALLAESGYDVWLFDVWAEHVKAIKEKGLNVEREGKTRAVKLNATAETDRLAKADLIIIFVKSTQTSVAAKTARGLIGPKSLVLTLQNGMGNADIIADTIDPKHVVSGTTAHGATLLAPGSIRHAGVGPTVIGMWAGGHPAQAHAIAKAFNKADIQTEVVEDVRSVVWDKLLVNVGINAITALTGIKNGHILDLEITKKLSQAAVEEAMAVARAQKMNIRDDAVEHVLRVAEATGPNRSSMGQDVDNKRQTEIGAINGVVVREGRKLGLQTPVNQTLTALIETMQAHYK
jgi:2-dehydropantoate 2-reductase